VTEWVEVSPGRWKRKKDLDKPRRERTSLQVHGDLPYQFKSPVDGSVIDSRAKLRAHNARNGVEDVGNDMPPGKYPHKPVEMESPREFLRHQFNR